MSIFKWGRDRGYGRQAETALALELSNLAPRNPQRQQAHEETHRRLMRTSAVYRSAHYSTRNTDAAALSEREMTECRDRVLAEVCAAYERELDELRQEVIKCRAQHFIPVATIKGGDQ